MILPNFCEIVSRYASIVCAHIRMNFTMWLNSEEMTENEREAKWAAFRMYMKLLYSTSKEKRMNVVQEDVGLKENDGYKSTYVKLDGKITEVFYKKIEDRTFYDWFFQTNRRVLYSFKELFSFDDFEIRFEQYNERKSIYPIGTANDSRLLKFTTEGQRGVDFFEKIIGMTKES